MNNRWLVAIECALFAAIYIGDVHGYIFVSKTLYLFALGWASLRIRGLRWASVGFESPSKAREATRPPNPGMTSFTPRDWPSVMSIGIAAGIGLVLLELFVSYPLLTQLTGAPPDISDFRPLIGNLKLFAVTLIALWLLAAFGEELVYRGYLMNRVADLAGGTQRAWMMSLVTVSLLFGTGHISQGITGMTENSINGLLLGGLYLACGRNLVVPIIAHGTSNTVDLVLIYLGRFPGL